MRDLVNIVPMHDPLVVLEISGQTIIDALENAVSAYPKLEGRFPQGNFQCYLSKKRFFKQKTVFLTFSINLRFGINFILLVNFFLSHLFN